MSSTKPRSISQRPRSQLEVKRWDIFPFFCSNFNVYEWIFQKLDVNNLLEMVMYFAKHSDMKVKGQGHNQRSKVKIWAILPFLGSNFK